MPTTRSRPCHVSTCGNVQPCEAHPRRRTYNRRAWRRLARRFLVLHPWCAECERRKRLTLATEVDHVLPHRGDDGLFWDEANWQGLCASCHGRKTGDEDR